MPGQVSIGTISDYELPPETLLGMWTASDVVVRARVTDSEQLALPGLRTAAPVVKHQALILEVFKAPATVAGQKHIAIAQPGGVIVSEERRIAEADRHFPVLQPGDEAVFFLVPWSAASAHASQWGPGGVFRISKETATVPGAAHGVLEFRGRQTLPVDQLVAQLRALAARIPELVPAAVKVHDA
jgi:hypothetical protein